MKKFYEVPEVEIKLFDNIVMDDPESEPDPDANDPANRPDDGGEL